MAKYNSKGEEIPDPTPVEVPLGYKAPRPLQDEIQRLIRQELSQAAEASGEETFEEADDFYVEEEEVWHSPYELTELQEEFVEVGADPAAARGSAASAESLVGEAGSEAAPSEETASAANPQAAGVVGKETAGHGDRIGSPVVLPKAEKEGKVHKRATR